MKDGEPVERHRIPPAGREVKSHGEVVIGTLLHTAGVPFFYQASFPLPPGKTRGALGADAPPEDLRGYRPDFYLPDDPKAPVTAEGGVWLEHYAHDRSGSAPAEFAGYEEARAWKRRLHESLSTRYIETSFGDLQRAWDGDGPGMAEVLVERLRAEGVEINDPKCWTVEAADDVGDGPDAGPDPLTLEVDAWIGAVRRRPAGRPPPTGRADVGALRRIGRAVRRRYERELADTRTTDHDGTILEATDAARRRPDLLPWHHVIVDEYQDVNPAQAAFVHALTTPKGPGPGGEGATLIGVGDDWQAIFGFQGGHASLIRTTADPAGVVQTLCKPLTLVNGYRFGQGLADASRAVVTMAPKVRDRRIRGLGPEPVGGVPPVSVTGARPTPILTAELGPTATPTTAAVLAAFAHWIPEHEAETGEEGGRARHRARDGPPEHRRVEPGARRPRQGGARPPPAESGGASVQPQGRSADRLRGAEVALDRAIAAETGGRRDDEHQLWYVALTRARYAALIVVSDPDGGVSPVTRATSTEPRCRGVRAVRPREPVRTRTRGVRLAQTRGSPRIGAPAVRDRTRQAPPRRRTSLPKTKSRWPPAAAGVGEDTPQDPHRGVSRPAGRPGRSTVCSRTVSSRTAARAFRGSTGPPLPEPAASPRDTASSSTSPGGREVKHPPRAVGG